MQQGTLAEMRAVRRATVAAALVAALTLVLAASTEPPARIRPIRVHPGTDGPAELGALEGVGPALLRRIQAWKVRLGPLEGPDSLLQIPGVGATLVHRWAPWLPPDRGLPRLNPGPKAR